MEELSNFVEGYVTGIFVTNLSSVGRAVSIFLLDRDRDNFVLKAEGVEKFIANEMREQNIIDRINVWNAKSDENSFRQILTTLISGKSEYEKLDDAFLPLIDQHIGAVRDGKKILIEIEPVYGVSVIILARNVSLTKQNNAENTLQ